jgi:hypothetical protein
MFLILRKTLFFHRSWLDYGPPYSALFASVSRVDASSRKYLNYNVLREIRAEESYEETGSHLAGVHHADPAVVYRDLTSKRTTNCRFKSKPTGKTDCSL